MGRDKEKGEMGDRKYYLDSYCLPVLVPKAQSLPFSSLSFLICLFSKFSLFYLSELTLFLSWNQKILPSNRELGWEDFRPRQSMKKSTEVQKVGCLKNEKEYGPSLV